MPSESEVIKALASVMDPELGRDIVSLGFVKHARVEGGRVSLEIELTTPACPMRDRIKSEIESAVGKLPGVQEVKVNMAGRVRADARQTSRLPAGVKTVIAIASGKGGVGKSTVSVNIACALAMRGARVGLVDLDAYGPTVPALLGISGEPRIENGKIVPLEGCGVSVVSTGFFMGKNEAAILRGPMLHKLVEQFLTQVEWGELDYLISDLPPGTGDVQLSLCQLVPVTGAVIVSTPQDVALNVARKAAVLFERMNVPVLGAIENMSYFVCPACGHREDVFGTGKVREAAQAAGWPFLGEIPLVPAIREASDAGSPAVLNQPDSPAAEAFAAAAGNLAAQISIRTLKGGS